MEESEIQLALEETVEEAPEDTEMETEIVEETGIEEIETELEEEMNQDELNSTENDPESPETSHAATENTADNNSVSAKINKCLRLPFSRIKQIMKSDPECTIVQPDAVFLVAKATEFFLEFMAKETYKNLVATKRKTLSRNDVDTTIRHVEQCFFLEGVFE